MYNGLDFLLYQHKLLAMKHNALSKRHCYLPKRFNPIPVLSSHFMPSACEHPTFAPRGDADNKSHQVWRCQWKLPHSNTHCKSPNNSSLLLGSPMRFSGLNPWISHNPYSFWASKVNPRYKHTTINKMKEYCISGETKPLGLNYVYTLSTYSINLCITVQVHYKLKLVCSRCHEVLSADFRGVLPWNLFLETPNLGVKVLNWGKDH